MVLSDEGLFMKMEITTNTFLHSVIYAYYKHNRVEQRLGQMHGMMSAIQGDSNLLKAQGAGIYNLLNLLSNVIGQNLFKEFSDFVQ
jgi:hypothetical protein